MLRKVKIALLLFCSLLCIYLYIHLKNQPPKLQAEFNSDLAIKHKGSLIGKKVEKPVRQIQEKNIQKKFSNIKENEIEKRLVTRMMVENSKVQI